jgi:hypothetical protein
LSSVVKEIIIVRSLAESDLGIFSAHRMSATSKQRAIAMTTPVAKQLLSRRLYEEQGTEMDVICVYGGFGNRERRHLGKVTKNWRLGGHKIPGSAFAFLDSKDFVLLRSVRANDGDTPILMTFVGRQRERLLHAGIVASLGTSLKDSVAVVPQGSEIFDALSVAFPPVPAELAVSIPSLDIEDEANDGLFAGRDGR